MIGFQTFDAQNFRRRIMEYSEKELVEMGRATCPARWLDPITKAENALKYEMCRQEWRKRHPKAK
jgi:hypothetical protein